MGRLMYSQAREEAVFPDDLVPNLIGKWSEETEKKILLVLAAHLWSPTARTA